MFNVAKKKDDAIALIFFGCIGLFITTLLLIFAFNDSSRGEDKSTGDLEAPPPIVSYPNVSDDFPAPPTPPPTPPPERPVHSSDETSDMLSNIYKIALVIIGLLSVFLIFLGIQVMRRVKRLRRYFALVTTQNMYSLDELAANTYKPVEFVRKDLQEMIDKGYIYYASINVTTNKLIISKPTPQNVQKNQQRRQTVNYAPATAPAPPAQKKPKIPWVAAGYFGTEAARRVGLDGRKNIATEAADKQREENRFKREAGLKELKDQQQKEKDEWWENRRK